MNDILYWTLGSFWLFACLALGFYIRSKSVIKHKFKLGLLAIFVSYLCGVGILIAALYV